MYSPSLISQVLSNGQICYGKRYSVANTESPVGVFIHGFRSSSKGTKATYFRDQAKQHGLAWMDFDLPCHGQSDGIFRSFRIRFALASLIGMLEKIDSDSIVLVGSSMGGWLSVLAMNELVRQGRSDLSERIKGMVLIAPAFDFIDHYFSQAIDVDMDAWKKNGVMGFNDAYDDERFYLDYGLLKDSEPHCVLKHPVRPSAPIKIFHGDCDEVVPCSISQQFVESVNGENVSIEIIAQGDHTLNAYLAHFWSDIHSLMAQAILGPYDSGPYDPGGSQITTR